MIKLIILFKNHDYIVITHTSAWFLDREIHQLVMIIKINVMNVYYFLKSSVKKDGESASR